MVQWEAWNGSKIKIFPIRYVCHMRCFYILENWRSSHLIRKTNISLVLRFGHLLLLVFCTLNFSKKQNVKSYLGKSQFGHDFARRLFTFTYIRLFFILKINSRINARANQATRVFKAQEVANLLWSMATLNVQPGTEMIDAISAYIASECQGKNGFDEYSIARIFKRQELTVSSFQSHNRSQKEILILYIIQQTFYLCHLLKNIAWSCAVLGRYPKQLMDIVYTGIFGTKNDPEQMKQIFNDDGLQKSSIMTFYYVSIDFLFVVFFRKMRKTHYFEKNLYVGSSCGRYRSSTS